MRIPLEDRLRYALLALLVLAVFYGIYFAKIGGTMKHYKKTITMLLTAAVLLVAVFMTGCTSLTEP